MNAAPEFSFYVFSAGFGNVYWDNIVDSLPKAKNFDLVPTAEQMYSNLLDILDETACDDVTMGANVAGNFVTLSQRQLFNSLGGGAAAAAASVAIVATLGSVLLSTGISMAVSGVTNMLFPPQQPSIGDTTAGLSETDSRVNFSFSGIQNVSRSGVCIPLIYGEVFTGSIVVSSGTDTAPVFKT